MYKVKKLHLGNHKLDTGENWSGFGFAVVDNEGLIYTDDNSPNIFDYKYVAQEMADHLNEQYYYSQEITEPANAQEGIANFVQMIINALEAGETREALMLAVDLQDDLVSKAGYKVTLKRSN